MGKIILSGFMLLLFLQPSSFTDSQTFIESLPGYSGILPFKLETGYIGVGENEDVQLFYYFVESQGNPEEDPTMIWLSGGPGCSGLRGFFYENGPLLFKYGEYVDDVPVLKLYPNSWTKVANMIYLDAPTFTGYSYAKTASMVSSDTLSASQTEEFVRKFVRNHPKFLKNPLYVTGMSYSGMVIPMVTEKIYKGNYEGVEPFLNIKGYMAGNPLTDKSNDVNSRLEYAYNLGFISYELFESTRRNCNEEYADADPDNIPCMMDIAQANELIENINFPQILDPNCESDKSNLVKVVNPIRHTNRKFPAHEQIRIRKTPSQIYRIRTSHEEVSCQVDNRIYVRIWANNGKVMKALNVRKGAIKEWSLCNLNMTYHYDKSAMASYVFNVRNSFFYHAKLTKRNCRALIFSGDHDMVVPHIGTQNWIKMLNLTITDSNWEKWDVNGQIAGYKTTYASNNYSLVFTTVKGGGHIAMEAKPKECYEMVKRWLAHSSI